MTAACLSEAAWQQRITDLASVRRWAWLHLRPARTAKGWRTPVSGPLGAGWPDLILIRRDRLVAIECKATTGKPTDEQAAVLSLLAQVRHVETHLARPTDWEKIMKVLQ